MELTLTSPIMPSSVTRTAAAPAAVKRPVEKSSHSPRPDALGITQQREPYLNEQSRLDRQVAEIIRRFTADGGSETGETGMTEDEMLQEELKTKMRCQKIAARIMAGDKVPPQDIKYLASHDMQTYKLAMAASMLAPKKNPKKWESALEDEEQDSGGSEEAGAASGEEIRMEAGGDSAGSNANVVGTFFARIPSNG